MSQNRKKTPPSRDMVFTTYKEILDCMERAWALLDHSVKVLPDVGGQREITYLVNQVTYLLEDFPEMASQAGYPELVDSIPTFGIDEDFVREFLGIKSMADRKAKLNAARGCKEYQHRVIASIESPTAGIELLSWMFERQRNAAAEADYQATEGQAVNKNDSESTESHNPLIGSNGNWKSNSTKGWAIDLDVTEKTIRNWFNEGREFINREKTGRYSIDTKHPFICSEGWKKNKRK